MEAAEDTEGVARDVLSEFWSSFYTECSLGNDKQVPFIRHDFGEEEWKSVARVIVFGWKTVNYFLVQLSSVFMEYCLYGTFHDDLLDAFMHYIPKADAETLKSALTDVNSVDQTDLDDIFFSTWTEKSTQAGTYRTDFEGNCSQGITLSCNVRYWLLESNFESDTYATGKTAEIVQRLNTNNQTRNKSPQVS